MNKLFVLLLTFSLLVGSVAAAQAQRGYPRGRRVVVPRARVYRQPYYAPHPRYYHVAPYRHYGGRAYYRPQPYYGQPRNYQRPVYRRGATVIIRR